MPKGQHDKGPLICICSGLHYRRGTPSLGKKPQSFIIGFKQTCPIFVLHCDIFNTLDSKLLSALEGDTVSPFPICSLYKHSWDYSLEHKTECLCFQETRETHGELCLPSYAFLLPLGKTCHCVIKVASWYCPWFYISLANALDLCILGEVGDWMASLVSALSTCHNESPAQVSVSLTQPLKPSFWVALT